MLYSPDNAGDVTLTDMTSLSNHSSSIHQVISNAQGDARRLQKANQGVVYAAFELGKSAQILEYLRMCPKPSKAAVIMALVAAAKQGSLAQVQEALGYVQGALADESQVGNTCDR